MRSCVSFGEEEEEEEECVWCPCVASIFEKVPE